MDELIDFEELIDLNLSALSVSQSSQEPIKDVLDKMCEVMEESNMATDNIFQNNQNNGEEIAPDDDIVNIDDFESVLDAASLCNDEFNLMADDLLDLNENCMIKDPNEAIIDLNEFIDCVFIDEHTTANSNSNIGNLQRVSSYEVPVEFEKDCEYDTECDAIKENTNYMEKYTMLHTISVERTTKSSEKEIKNCINLETFEFDTVNPVRKINTDDKEFDKILNTVTADCKNGANRTEDIITLTINDSEIKYEIGTEPTKADCKTKIDTVTEDTNENINTDSEDDYDQFDFEFITEEEASKVGIFTRVSKTINENNNLAPHKTQHKQQNNCIVQGTSNDNIYYRQRNEASLSDYVKYSKYRYKRCYSRPASELHVIPEGERYLDMFRGEYAPAVLNNLYSVRNKRVLPTVAMAASFGDLTYRDPRLADEDNEKYKDDVEDCQNKILSKYPLENRKKRRRQ